jgi:hypothetical protein
MSGLENSVVVTGTEHLFLYVAYYLCSSTSILNTLSITLRPSPVLNDIITFHISINYEPGSHPPHERPFLKFLESSRVGRIMADGTDENGARAASMDEWIVREAEERVAPGAPI